MRNYFNFLLIILLIIFSCQRNPLTIVRGTVINPQDSVIRINDSEIRIKDHSEFIYKSRIGEPTTAEIRYQDSEWLIYLKPGDELQMTFDGNDPVNTLKFEGDRTAINDLLLSMAKQSAEVSPWFQTKWYNLYTKEERAFIHVIDSLQDTFLLMIEKFQEKHNFSDSVFLKKLIAETYFSFNRLVLLYPSQYEGFTSKEVTLSQATIERLSQTEINDPDFLNLEYYEDYCRNWIEFKLQQRLKKNHGTRNYYLNRMDELFRLLPDMFTNAELLDFWLAGYLTGHIENYGISNSKDYVEKFNTICSTERYGQQVEKAYHDKLNVNRDHSMEIYKTVRGFHLEVHIFLPGTRQAEEKVSGIVLFHGGGWSAGNPSWMFSRARHFARKGMIAVAAQYRLSNQAGITPLEGMEDARDIIRWMRSKADSIGLIPDSIVAYGYSAGGHLAATAAIFPGISIGDYSAGPNALVLVSPALDLVNDGWSQLLVGSRADIRTISPAEHVRKNLPPTIILQGRDDTVTPLKGAKLFCDKMIAAGNDCELWIYDDVGHLFTPNTMRDDGWPQPDPHVQQEAFEQADKFLQRLGYFK